MGGEIKWSRMPLQGQTFYDSNFLIISPFLSNCTVHSSLKRKKKKTQNLVLYSIHVFAHAISPFGNAFPHLSLKMLFKCYALHECCSKKRPISPLKLLELISFLGSDTTLWTNILYPPPDCNRGSMSFSLMHSAHCAQDCASYIIGYYNAYWINEIWNFNYM